MTFRSRNKSNTFLVSADYNGCFNDFNYDCYRNRRPNFCYTSLSKPMRYNYKCVDMKVVYGRCEVNQCVIMSESCGKCNDDIGINASACSTVD